jgi:hypothetical protein
MYWTVCSTYTYKYDWYIYSWHCTYSFSVISRTTYSILICNVCKIRELYGKATCFPTSKSNTKNARHMHAEAFVWSLWTYASCCLWDVNDVQQLCKGIWIWKGRGKNYPIISLHWGFYILSVFQPFKFMKINFASLFSLSFVRWWLLVTLANQEPRLCRCSIVR